jgi:pre-mRNA-processing factor 6
MARALQECPAAGLLWAEDILTAHRSAQKRKSADALARCDTDARVVAAIARLFAAFQSQLGPGAAEVMSLHGARCSR